jgi:NitT/TauT family transport system substrate-binding protein
MSTKNDTGSTIITATPPKTAYSNSYVKKALAELKTEGVDTTGASFTPLTVTLKEGGK